MNEELAERLYDLNYVLSYEEIEELRNICYEHSNSWCPLSDFFNDIYWNESKTYNKNQAFKDLWLIVLIVLGRENEHKALEIIKEKEVNVFDILATNCADYYNMSVSLRISPEYCSSYFLTQEEYDLLKEVLCNN